MMCSRCGEQQAVVHCLQKMDTTDNFLDLDLCDDCWKLFEKKYDELQKLFSNIENIIEEFPEKEECFVLPKICDQCKTTKDDLLNNHKLGCQNCYVVFKEELDGVMKVLHGADKHVGKKLDQKMVMVSKEKKVDESKKRKLKLQKDLDRAILYEEYEKAAQIRDEIKEMEI